MSTSQPENGQPESQPLPTSKSSVWSKASTTKKSNCLTISLIVASCGFLVIAIIAWWVISTMNSMHEMANKVTCLYHLRNLRDAEILFENGNNQKSSLDILISSEKVQEILPSSAPKPDISDITVSEYMIKYPKYNYIPFALLYDKGLTYDATFFVCESQPNYPYQHFVSGDFASKDTSYYCNPYMTAESSANTIFIWDKPGAHNNKGVVVAYKNKDSKYYVFPSNITDYDKFAKDFSQSILERKNRSLVDSVFNGEADLSDFSD